MPVNRKYRVFGFTFARYRRVGSVSVLNVLGLDAYKRVGSCRQIMGLIC